MTHAIGAVILAAGASSRMGAPKQLLEHEGISFVRRAATAALDAGCSPVVVVTGANANATSRQLERLDVSAVYNPEWESGMASSVRRGIDALVAADQEVSATVILVCDQPHVTADVIRSLMATHRTKETSLVASSYAGTAGVPALFRRDLFAELMRLDGVAGARKVIERHLNEAQLIDFAAGAVDIDTPEDFAQLNTTFESACRRLRSCGPPPAHEARGC